MSRETRQIAAYKAMKAFGKVSKKAGLATIKAPFQAVAWLGGEYSIKKSYNKYGMKVPYASEDVRFKTWKAGGIGSVLGSFIAFPTLDPEINLPVETETAIWCLAAAPMVLSVLGNRLHATYKSGQLHEQYLPIEERKTKRLEAPKETPKLT